MDFSHESKTFYDDMHCFFKFWKFSLAIPIERSDFSFKSKSFFVNLKDQFLTSLRVNDANAKTLLVPLIYWCLNFTHPRNFDIKFFSQFFSSPADPNLSDPRDIILIILCSRSIFSLESRFAFAKNLYSNSKWFLSAESFEFFEYVRFFFFDRIPSNLFRKSDSSDWDDWHNHFKTVIDNLACFNSHAFESLSRQVLCLKDRDVGIHETTLSFKQRIEDTAINICRPIASEGDLAPVFTIFEELLERNTKDQRDYSPDLSLPGDVWLFDLLNGLGRYISDCLDSNLSEVLSYDTAKRVICSLASKEMSELRTSVTNSRKKKGIFKFFGTFDGLIQTTFRDLPPLVERQEDSGENVLLNDVTERVNFRKSFLDWLHCIEYDDWAYSIKYKKDDDKVLFDFKYDFWSGPKFHIVRFLRLFRSQTYFKLLHSWIDFLKEIPSIIKYQEEVELKYPRLKINLFSGVTMYAKVIEDRNMQSVVSTMDSFFRLMERFVDLKSSKERIGEFLQRAMFIPFLFHPSEFKDPTRDVTFTETIDWYDIFYGQDYFNYCRGLYSKYESLCDHFKESYKPEPPKTLDSEFVHLFELIKKLIYRREIPLDPAQFMAFGRNITSELLFRDQDTRAYIDTWYQPVIAAIKYLLKALTDKSNNDLVVITLNLKSALASLVPPKFTEIFRNMRFPLFSGYILKWVVRGAIYCREISNIAKIFQVVFAAR